MSLSCTVIASGRFCVVEIAELWQMFPYLFTCVQFSGRYINAASWGFINVGRFINCSGKCMNVVGDVITYCGYLQVNCVIYNLMHEEIDKCTISSRHYLSVVVSPMAAPASKFSVH